MSVRKAESATSPYKPPSGAAAGTVIQTDGLTRDFGPLRALEGLTLTVPAGIVFGFLGPNGSGKTTMIRLLLGILEPTAGRATVLGYDSVREAEEVRTRAGALLEHTGLYERLSAADNLEFYGRIFRLSPADRRRRAEELLTSLGLWERRNERVEGWSRGMKQKLAIARALLHRPALVFLDEPTAGLDPAAAVALQEELAQLTRREGVTVFLTTHNLSEAERLCALVGVIQQGHLVAVGSPADLRARTGRPQVTLFGRGFTDALLMDLRALPGVVTVAQYGDRLTVDCAGPCSAAPMVRAAVTHGAEVEEVQRGSGNLEQAFLQLTGATSHADVAAMQGT